MITSVAPLLLSIGKLTRDEIPSTAALLADAFSENPCYAYMHPRSATRARDLRSFFERNLHWHAPYDLTWVARDEAGRPIGTATLEPPTGVKGTLSDMLSLWVIPTLREQGLHTLTRISRTGDAFAKQNRRVAGQDTYWHVHAVAIAPREQGRGIGTKLMSHVLDALAGLRQRQPAPVVISTQKTANVRFYEGFGFRLVDQMRMGRSFRSQGFESWFMRTA